MEVDVVEVVTCDEVEVLRVLTMASVMITGACCEVVDTMVEEVSGAVVLTVVRVVLGCSVDSATVTGSTGGVIALVMVVVKVLG